MANTAASAIAAHRIPIVEPASRPPALFVVVDTEEEFDWNAPFSRAATSVTHIGDLVRFQDACDAEGVRPIYVMDFPIVTDRQAVETFGRWHSEQRAFLGCHLHPWVNPPLEEAVCAHNSYQGNLPEPLERAKLAALSAAFRGSFGMIPRIHKAGRYGFGPNTARILSDLNYAIDLSASPGFDLTRDGGPDYMSLPPQPCWLGRPGGLLELPDTGGFIGLLSRFGASLFPLAETRLGHQVRLHGVLSRLSLLARLRMSPEGHSLDDLRRMAEHLFASGLRSFSLTLHSPSLKPGCTPYVSDNAERDRLIDTVRRFVSWFRTDLHGVFPDPLVHREALSSGVVQ